MITRSRVSFSCVLTWFGIVMFPSFVWSAPRVVVDTLGPSETWPSSFGGRRRASFSHSRMVWSLALAFSAISAMPSRVSSSICAGLCLPVQLRVQRVCLRLWGHRLPLPEWSWILCLCLSPSFACFPRCKRSIWGSCCEVCLNRKAGFVR